MPQRLHAEDEDDVEEESSDHPASSAETDVQKEAAQTQQESVEKDSDEQEHTFGQGIL